ncbi:MAG: phytanoyl-CoA dioxygenase family protein, partial [Rhodospirillales bacterium]
MPTISLPDRFWKTDSAAARAFQEDGFAALPGAALTEAGDLAQRIDALSDQKALFELNPKNQGAKSLTPEAVNEHAPLFMDYLFETGAYEAMVRAVGQPLYLTNILHTVTEPGVGSYRWHRDSYWTGRGAVGPFPSAVKLSVVCRDLAEDGGPTELVPGSHRFSRRSHLADIAFAALFAKTQRLAGKAGDSFVFDGAIMHRRSPHKGQAQPRVYAMIGFTKTR